MEMLHSSWRGPVAVHYPYLDCIGTATSFIILLSLSIDQKPESAELQFGTAWLHWLQKIAAGPVKVLESISLAFFSLTVSKYVGKRCNDWLLNPTSNATNSEDI